MHNLCTEMFLLIKSYYLSKKNLAEISKDLALAGSSNILKRRKDVSVGLSGFRFLIRESITDPYESGSELLHSPVDPHGTWIGLLIVGLDGFHWAWFPVHSPSS